MQPNSPFDPMKPAYDRLRALGVLRLALFGSAVRGELTPASDIDVLIRLGNVTFDRYFGVKESLEGAFGRRVDLVMENTIKPQLRDRILAEAIDAPGF
ncbi:MAG: nucleotidyltransferase family protein [Gemmataceae bacterium]|nr:nucleotidyltransferase family protein [Gemmataceae bacterium]